MTQPLIEVFDLHKTYPLEGGGVPALGGISFSIAEGEFVVVTGPSGSGKSTLLDILGCLDEPTSGTVRFRGRDLRKIPRAEQAQLRNRSFGFVFQNFNLLERADIAENVEMPLIYSGIKRRERREKALALIDKLGLTGFLRHHPAQLSGGQQQRVAIARALVNRPDVLYADEPTGNLDTRTGLEVIGILKRLNREEGLTVVLVTHEPDIVRFAGRIVALRDGKIAADAAEPEKQT